MLVSAPTEPQKGDTSYIEGVTRTVLSTLAASSITYCFVHVGQQTLRVPYRSKYRIIIPALVSAAVASYTTVWKMKQYKLLH